MSYAGLKASTGEVIGDALVQLGGVGLDEAVKWNRLDADLQVSQATRNAGMRLAQLAEEVNEDDDPTTYRAKFESAMTDIKALRPKSKLGAGMYDTWLGQKEPAWRIATAETIKRKLAKQADEDIQQRKGDYEGKLEKQLTEVIFEQGTDAAIKYVQNPYTKAQSQQNHVTEEETMLIVRRAGSNADQLKAEEREKSLLLEKDVKRKKDAMVRETTNLLMVKAIDINTGTASAQDVSAYPALIQKALAANLIDRTDASVMLNFAKREKEPDLSKQNIAYTKMREATSAVREQRMSRTEWKLVWQKYAGDLGPSDSKKFTDEINEMTGTDTKGNKIPLAQLTELQRLKDEAVRIAVQEVVLPMFRAPGVSPEAVQDRIDEMSGAMARKIDQWADEKYKDAPQIDRNKFMEGAVDSIIQVHDSYLSGPLLGTPETGKHHWGWGALPGSAAIPGSVPFSGKLPDPPSPPLPPPEPMPPDFDEQISHLSESERKRMRAAAEREAQTPGGKVQTRLKMFLEKYPKQ